MSKKKLEVNLKRASYDILKQLYKSEKVSKVKTRFLILLYFLYGFNSLEISKLIHHSNSTVRRCLHKYNNLGIDGLKDSTYGHRPSILSDIELIQIDKALSDSPNQSDFNYNNWTSKLLVEFVRRNFNKSTSVNTALSTIHKLNYSKTRSKKMSSKVNKLALEDFRDKLSQIINSKDCDVEIMYEDECILTSEETTTSVWSKVVKQVIVKTNGTKRKIKVIFGAVNPHTGQLIQQYSDNGNSESFSSFFK